MVATVPPVAPPPLTQEQKEAAFADILTELEARCDQCEAMVKEAAERCREGRERLAEYRKTQRKVSVRWQ